MRSFFVLALVGGLGLLAGCGGGSSSSGGGGGVSVALVPDTKWSIVEGEAVIITATVSNDSNNQGVTWTLTPSIGALSNQTATSVTYTAPSNQSSNAVTTLTATAVADSSATVSLQLNVIPGSAPNIQPITVDGGPASFIYPNGLFTSVTICVPGTAQCQTIPGVLVDSGSFGLRLLQSVIKIPITPETASNGDTINDCVAFLDQSYLWGPVAPFDVELAGEAASSTPIHVISSSNTGVPDSCSNGGSINENTVDKLGANGILGVGPEPTDCTLAGTNFCDPTSGKTPPPIYYQCPGNTCQASTQPSSLTVSDQVTNPVVLFPTDNNGVIVELSSVLSQAAFADGSMIFGIGTQANNGLGNTTVYTMDSSDSFTTAYNGQNLTDSFIDSGSNGYFFPDSSLPVCATFIDFFCPTSGGLPATASLSAVNQGANNAQGTVNFDVDNAEAVFQNSSDAAYSGLAGPLDPSFGSFDWGLPFFYGRNVFTAVDEQPVPSGAPAAPWWAY